MKTVRDILFDAAARCPDANAIHDGDKTWTYYQLLDVCERLAGGLMSMGMKPGDHLATVMQNRAELVMLYWATQLSGLILTPLNWRIGPDEIDYFLRDSGARAIVFETRTKQAVLDSQMTNTILSISIEADGATGITFDDLIAPSQDNHHLCVDAETTSIMLYTSGTTGVGKGVPRSHRAERAAAIAHIAQNAVMFGERTLGVMPLYHTMGVRLLLVMGLVNGTFICQRRFDPKEAIRLIERHEVTELYLVPTLFHDLIASDGFCKTAAASVRKLGFAGAPMTDGLLRRLEQEFAPDLIVNHYGSTEIYTFSVDQNAGAKPGSAGKAGLNSRIKIVEIGRSDPESIMPPRSAGEVIASLSSDEAFTGYWNRPDADDKALIDGWYFTGDVGYFDEDGDLFIIGRVDDMMITGGENVLPVEIESVLSLHPAVAEVAVAGVPDARLGHCITAFVIARHSTSPEELDQWCRLSPLANFKRPRRYDFVEVIPKSPVGKILRRHLTDSAKARGAAAECGAVASGIAHPNRHQSLPAERKRVHDRPEPTE